MKKRTTKTEKPKKIKTTTLSMVHSAESLVGTLMGMLALAGFFLASSTTDELWILIPITIILLYIGMLLLIERILINIEEEIKERIITDEQQSLAFEKFQTSRRNKLFTDFCLMTKTTPPTSDGGCKCLYMENRNSEA